MSLTIDEAKKLVIEFCATYPVASNIPYKLRNTQEEALDEPKATIEREGRILGAYFPRRGYAAFAVSNFRDADEFKGTLRHEILGHYGVNTFKPEEKRAVLEQLIESRSEPGIEAIWETVDRAYPALDELRRAEEVYAFACEIIEPDSRANVAIGLRSFQEACIERLRPMSYGDLMNVTAMVAEGMHDRSRWQQNFPASDDAQFKIEKTPNIAEHPMWLAVPFDAREAVREAAGRLENGQSAISWDEDSSLWFARPGADLDRVAQWRPDSSIRTGGGDPEADFLGALTREGLVLQGMPIMDGQRHRVSTVEDKKGNKSGVYRGFLDRRPGGWFINYHRAETEKSVTNWSAKGGDADPVARLHISAAARQSQDDAQRKQQHLYEQQTQAAKKLYDRLPGADPAHPYLVRKGIPPTPDLRQTRNGALVVPFFNASGTFKTLQYIPPEGEKYLFKDAPKQGHFLVVGGSLTPGQPVLYAEGYATARSLNLATGVPVVMTIDAGNMVAVAKVLHERFPDSPHVFLADFDHAKEVNKGLEMATMAAEQVGGQVLYPAFTEAEIAQGFTDFNDLHHSRGLDAVRDQTAHLFTQPIEVATMQEKSTYESLPDSESVPSVQPPMTPESAASHVLRVVREPGFAPELLPMAQRELNRFITEALGKSSGDAADSNRQVALPVLWTGETETVGHIVMNGVVELAGKRNPEIFSVYAKDYDGSSVWVAVFGSEARADEFVSKLQLIESNARPLDRDFPSITATNAAIDNASTLGSYSGATVDQGFTDFNDNDLHQSRGLDAVRNLVGPGVLNFTHNGEPVRLDLERFRTSQQVEPQTPPVEQGSGVAPATPVFTYNGEPASLGLNPGARPAPLMPSEDSTVLHSSDPESHGVISDSQQALEAQWTAHQWERLNSRTATEQSVFADIENVLKTEKFELKAQIATLRQDKSADNSDAVQDRKSTIKVIDAALNEMNQRRDYDGDPTRLPLLDHLQYERARDEQSVVQGRGIDGTLRDDWVKEQMQQPGSTGDLRVTGDGRGFQADRTARAEALLSRVLVLGDNAEVATLIRGEINARLTENNTLASSQVHEIKDPAPTSTETATVVQSVVADNPGPAVVETKQQAVPSDDQAWRPGQRPEEQLNMALDPALAPTASEEPVVAPTAQPAVLQALPSEAEPAPADASLLERKQSTPAPEQEAPVASDDLAPVSRSSDAGDDPLPVAPDEVDSIQVGAPRPRGTEVEPQLSNMDLDALQTRMSREVQGDTVLYKLDGEPAFVDHGARLQMAAGAGQSDEKIVAALITAAQFYRGSIELTGSDAFKAKAIGLIALHQINVEMKNPAQRVLLDDARKALTAEPVVPDAIAGEAPPAYGPVAAAPSQAAAEPAPATATPPAPELQPKPSAAAPAAPNRVAEPVPEKPAAQPQGISAQVHQSADKAKDGVVGKVMECGVAPYHFNDKNDPQAFIKLRTKEGTQTFWGKELAGLMRETRIHPGKIVTLQWLGKEPVTIQAPVKDKEGNTLRFEEKSTHRNQWALTVKGGETVRSGQDEGVKLAPYDAVRFAVVQQTVINRLGLDVPVPASPKDGLYWMTPNGQGSAKAGDELSAQRPAVDPQKSAGQPVISSWSQDGHLDMLLVRADGPYLQGVVRQGNAFQHVLVSLPGSSDAPAMVFNAITPEGLVPIGTGNGINRSGGVPVSRENIAFKLEGDQATRIAKLDAPAEVPPALHSRLGFDERWKEDNSLPKSAPTAAPVAQPSDPRPA